MNWKCLIGRHAVRSIESDWLCFQKGDTRPTREYFSGVYQECRRPGCEWSCFIGDRRAHTRTVEVRGCEMIIGVDLAKEGSDETVAAHYVDGRLDHLVRMHSA